MAGLFYHAARMSLIPCVQRALLRPRHLKIHGPEYLSYCLHFAEVETEAQGVEVSTLGQICKRTDTFEPSSVTQEVPPHSGSLSVKWAALVLLSPTQKSDPTPIPCLLGPQRVGKS